MSELKVRLEVVELRKKIHELQDMVLMLANKIYELEHGPVNLPSDKEQVMP